MIIILELKTRGTNKIPPFLRISLFQLPELLTRQVVSVGLEHLNQAGLYVVFRAKATCRGHVLLNPQIILLAGSREFWDHPWDRTSPTRHSSLRHSPGITDSLAYACLLIS